jgi:hypothetical protein
MRMVRRLDLGQRDPDVPRDEEALVEDPVEHVDEAGAPLRSGR